MDTIIEQESGKEKSTKIHYCINRDRICAGILSRLIITRQPQSDSSFVAMGTKEDGKMVYYQDVRKIVFDNIGEYGNDLKLKSGKSLYSYYLFDPKIGDYVQPENNELFIRRFKPFGAFLEYLGFNRHMSVSEVSKAVSILLSKDVILTVPKHDMVLPGLEEEFIDSAFIEQVNTQAADLAQFVGIELPSKAQPIEKVIKKITSQI